MTRFLDWYNDELLALRRRAGAFAERHPKIAGRLRMTPEAVDDPHVERLMQGFAFSAARIRNKLEDDFPELTDTLLEALYPQYLAPIPSMSVVKFEPSADLDEPATLPRGFEVTTEAVRGDRCRYRTTRDIEMLPARVGNCTLEKPPFQAPPAPHIPARSCTTITLEAQGSVSFNEIGSFDPVFHVRAPFAEATRLFEMMCNRTLGVAVASYPDADDVVWLPPSAIEPMGFGEDEAALPFPKRSFPGFRLLTEFFALPEKFLFFRVRLGDAAARMRERFSIYVFGDANPDRLVRAVESNTFDLHCSPVVNLFQQQAEPVHLDNTRHEYELVSDTRHHATREIHSIDRVMLTGARGGQEEARPFFGRKPLSAENRSKVFWQHKREIEEDGVPISRLAFVDLSLNASTPNDRTVASIDTTCLNRTLPELLPFGGGQPYLSVGPVGGQAASARMLLAPTPTTRFDRDEGSTWRLVSHLSLNHLALTGGDPDLLRDMLRLYDYRGVQETGVLIEAITEVASARATARLADGSVVNGVDVTITFDEALVDRGQAFLMGSVLSHFLGLYASINTFSRLTVRLSNVSVPVVRFPPRTAEETLL